MAAVGARLDAGREEHLGRRVGEDNRGHVAAIGDEARHPAEGALAEQQCRAHRRQRGHLRGARGDFLAADRLTDLLARKPDRVYAEDDVEPGGDRRDARLVVPGDPGALRGQCRQPVQRARVEIIPAERRRHACGDGPLAGGGRAVDVDHRHRFGQGREAFEVIGEGLGDAARIVDAHRNTDRSERETHRDAVIVVGVDGRRTQAARCGRLDAQPVGALLDPGAELDDFGRHRAQAVGLLDAPAADVAQDRRPLGKERQRHQRHRRVGDVVAVEIDAAQPPFCRRRCLDPVRPQRDARAHRHQCIGETDVALDRIAADALDANRPAARRSQGPQCEEVRGGGGVALDMDEARRAVGRRRNDETRLAVGRGNNAEARHRGQGDVDVRPGNQLADHLHRGAAGLRQRHQQAAQELAGDVATNADEPPGSFRGKTSRRSDRQRRIALVAEIADVGTGLAQRVDEIADRPLVHARRSAQDVVAAGKGQRRGQRTEGRPGIAEEEIGLAHREDTADAMHAQRGRLARRGRFLFDAHAERLQRVEHARGVV